MNIYKGLRRTTLLTVSVAVVLLYILPAISVADAGTLTSAALQRPARVKNVTVSNVTETGATVQWNKAQRAKKYQVRVKKGTTVTTTLQTKKLKKKVTDLSAGTTYSVRVRGLGGSVRGKWSKAMSFTTESSVDEGESLYDRYKSIAGDYAGAWNNLTYSTTGDSTNSIVIEEDGAASFTLDLGGFVFGLIDPDPKTYTSTYDENGAVFTATDDDLFGDMTITVVAGESGEPGTVDFQGLDVPVAGIDSITATGTIDDTEITLNYEIQFSPIGTAEGVFTLIK